jgi:hypothetical protein
MARYLTATIGAIFMLVAVFILTGIFIRPFLPAFFQSYIHAGGFGTNNIAGVILAPIAAASSFLASVRMKK